MLRPRFTVRRMMAAVAIVGVFTWFVMVPLPAEYRDCAKSHEERAEMAWQGLYSDRTAWARGLPGKLNAYHMAMKIKYERAAKRPWIPIWFDPPAPE